MTENKLYQSKTKDEAGSEAKKIKAERKEKIR